MRTTFVAAVAATASGASAFVAPSAPVHAQQCIRSPSATTLTMAATMEAPVATAVPLTRFERMRKSWKGAVTSNTESEEDNDVYSELSTMLDDQQVSFGRGQTVKGRVVQYEPGGALIDIGAKASAYLPLREVGLQTVDHIEDALELDSDAEFMVITDENADGQVLVSVRRLEYERAWEKVQAMQTTDEAFNAEIVAVNKGGAIVMVNGLRAFLPGSHLCGVQATEEIVGQMRPFKFLEVNPETKKLVVSNRRAVLELEMKELARGDVVDGVIKAIKPYGAFVEIRGMSGLLHISQISYDRIEDLSAILYPNMQVKCMIIDHDKVNGRIALSTKTLEPEPGDMLRNPSKVFEQAEETAAKYHQRMEAERKAREEAAKSIVMGLGEGLDFSDNDVLAGLADGIESVLD